MRCGVKNSQILAILPYFVWSFTEPMFVRVGSGVENGLLYDFYLRSSHATFVDCAACRSSFNIDCGFDMSQVFITCFKMLRQFSIFVLCTTVAELS